MRSFLLYIEPGSGSYLLQVIVAGIMGAGVVVKTYWWRIRMFFGKKKNASQDKQDSI
ncbi:hypothetical protein [Flaviaesturariibacter flavus]|uniref:hypothetical protein n=1 Tax=Flaviaesturariibacter flavus TaxID=2502780 RepID=UPI00140513A8|nr:hypothetical protein [Flaviaesturariibacter flavus]